MGDHGAVMKVTRLRQQGSVNAAFLVECSSGRFVLRTGRDEFHTYRKEAWCMDKASACGVPTARQIAYGKNSSGDFSLQSAIDGVDGRDFTGDKQSMWREMGRLARIINTIPTPGYGYDLRSGWSEFIDWSLTNIFRDALFESSGILSWKQVTAAKKMISSMAEWRFKPHLAHGNLSPGNVLIDSSGKLHVVDWGSAIGARVPHFEVADVLAWGWGRKFERAFLEGMGIGGERFQELRDDVEKVIVWRFMDSIRWASKSKPDWKALDFVTRAASRLGFLIK